VAQESVVVVRAGDEVWYEYPRGPLKHGVVERVERVQSWDGRRYCRVLFDDDTADPRVPADRLTISAQESLIARCSGSR